MMPFTIKGKLKLKPKNRVGLDIGSYAIKLVEIHDSQERPTLAGFGLRVIQSPSKEVLPDIIKSLAEEARISIKDVNIAISGSSVIVRIISMPKMRDDELKGAIRFEAERFIPFNINDCIVDHQILKKDEKENKLEILLVVAKKDHVEENLRRVESCGYSVSLVDVDSFAVTNSFRRNHPALDPERIVALLNIGATLTNLSIIKGDALCLVRDIAIGGGDFNVAISKALGVDIGSAEDLKLSPREKAEEVATCVRSVLNNLADEVRLSCSYYENQYGRSVDEFYISGGGACLIGLEDALQDALGSKPILWNPMQFLDITSGTIDAGLLDRTKGSFAVAVGLALR